MAPGQKKYHCTGCGKSIRIRYHCVSCRDLDWCKKCHSTSICAVAGHRLSQLFHNQSVPENEQQGRDGSGSDLMTLLGPDLPDLDDEDDHDYVDQHDETMQSGDELDHSGSEDGSDPEELSLHPVPDSRLHDQIELLAARTPRFLFRGWHKLSGGSSALNTKEAITPKHFLQPSRRLTIHDLDRKDLTRLAQMHLGGDRHDDTVFSSWSQSFTVALGFSQYDVALQSGSNIEESSHISIIDTKQLGPNNTVLFTPGMSLISWHIGAFNNEFLAFGKISGGDCHKAVSAKELHAAGFTQFFAHSFQYPISLSHIHDTARPDLKTAATAAWSIGKLFGEKFQVPVAAYLLSGWGLNGSQPPHTAGPTRSEATIDQIVAALSDLGATVPFEWCQDPTIMAFENFNTGYRDSLGASEILRALVNKEHGRGAKREAAAMLGRIPQHIREDNPQSKAEAIRKARKIPRELSNLSIDMNGWDED